MSTDHLIHRIQHISFTVLLREANPRFLGPAVMREAFGDKHNFHYKLHKGQTLWGNRDGDSLIVLGKDGLSFQRQINSPLNTRASLVTVVRDLKLDSEALLNASRTQIENMGRIGIQMQVTLRMPPTLLAHFLHNSSAQILKRLEFQRTREPTSNKPWHIVFVEVLDVHQPVGSSHASISVGVQIDHPCMEEHWDSIFEILDSFLNTALEETHDLFHSLLW